MDELVVEISDLRIRLAEAKGEKEELNGKLQVVLEQQRKWWIEKLENMISVREYFMCSCTLAYRYRYMYCSNIYYILVHHCTLPILSTIEA